MKTTQTIHTLVELAIEGFPYFVDTDNLEKVITKKCNLSWQLAFTEDDQGELTITPVIIEQPKIKVWYIENKDDKSFEIDLSKLELTMMDFISFGGNSNHPNPIPMNYINLRPKTLYIDMMQDIYWIEY